MKTTICTPEAGGVLRCVEQAEPTTTVEYVALGLMIALALALVLWVHLERRRWARERGWR